jgi:hypothetical protein
VELVRFSGGEHSGLLVEAPADVAERLPVMRFVVLAGGQLFDPVEQCRIPGTRVVRWPGQPPSTAAPAAKLAAPVPARAADLDRVAVGREVASRPAAPAAASRPRRTPPGAPVFRSGRARES